MPLNKRAIFKIDEFDFGLSYRLDEKRKSFREAKNVMLNKKRLEKRYGIAPQSESPPAFSNPQSLSYLKRSNGSRSFLIKDAASFLRISEDGQDTFGVGLSSLSQLGRHRSITLNDRSIIADTNGLFQFDGVTMNTLGSTPPIVPTISVQTGGGSIDAGNYRVKTTFYSSVTGYESNPSPQSNEVTIVAGQFVRVFNTSNSNPNTTIDKIRIYIKRSTQVDYLFALEVPLAQANSDVLSNSLSSQVPPDNSDLPPTGGVKYLAEFNGKLVISGIEQYPNEFWMSNQDDPESFDNGGVRFALSGDGPITGMQTGFFSDSVMDPYLVIFKKNKTFVYSEIGEQPRLVELDARIGCASHDTIVVRNGDVYFMSEFGFYGISNGKIIKKDGDPYPLGGGLIDDIFTEREFDKKLNRSKFSDFFSVYYQTQDLYVTWVTEGSGQYFNKAYAFHFALDGFTEWYFPINFVFSIVGEDSSGNETIFTPSVIPASGFQSNCIHQINKNNIFKDRYFPQDSVLATEQAIEVNGVINWKDGGDYDSSFNFRELLIRAPRNQQDITVNSWVNYTLKNQTSKTYTLPDPDGTFTLDVSQLDVGILGEGRDVVTSRNDLNLCGESILIGFYQNTIDANIVVCSMQLNFSKNGNRNI